MAKNISLLGADYPDVPAVTLPQTGGGTATFYDVEVTDGDPTLAWGTRSKVGTVQGTDLHVTMPANPAPGVIDNLTSSSTTNALAAKQGNTLRNMIHGTMHRSDMKAVTPSANGNVNLDIGPDDYVVSVQCISTDDVVCTPFLSSTHAKWWCELRWATGTHAPITSGNFNLYVIYYTWDSSY